MAPSWLLPRRLIAAGAEAQVDPAALELQLVDLALAVVLSRPRPRGFNRLATAVDAQ